VTELSAIIFDLDDTLFPERSFVLGGFEAAAKHAASLAPIDAQLLLAQLHQLFENGVRGNTFQIALDLLGQHNHALEQAMVAAYRNHAPQIKAFPEVTPTLSRLHGKYQIGLVSDGFLSVQQRKFQALGLADFFDTVVFSDEFGRDHWKPSTKPFEVALERLMLNRADRAVYVADNVTKDFWGARRLGIHTIRIRRESGEYAAAQAPSDAHQPDLEICDLTELESAVDRL
jgi:putative hydrolase of the HAD superfamily